VRIFFFQQQQVQTQRAEQAGQLFLQAPAQFLSFPVVLGMLQEDHPQVGRFPGRRQLPGRPKAEGLIPFASRRNRPNRPDKSSRY
jgi:hypothetical protein